MAVVIINAVLGVYQENKAEKAIEALQEMSAATSKVLRDGKLTILHSDELVPGDVVLLEAGDAVPADGRIIENASLKIEEAALTGESVPVNKMIDILQLKDANSDVPLGDRKNMCYMGSTVVYGRGRAVITETGMNTEMGKIADALAKAQEGQTPLQIKLAGLSKILTWLVIGICVVIFGVLIDVLGLVFPWYVIPYCAVLVTLGVILIEGKSVIENYRKKRSSAANVVEMIETIIKCSDNDTAEKLIKASSYSFLNPETTRLVEALFMTVRNSQ